MARHTHTHTHTSDPHASDTHAGRCRRVCTNTHTRARMKTDECRWEVPPCCRLAYTDLDRQTRDDHAVCACVHVCVCVSQDPTRCTFFQWEDGLDSRGRAPAAYGTGGGPGGAGNDYGDRTYNAGGGATGGGGGGGNCFNCGQPGMQTHSLLHRHRHTYAHTHTHTHRHTHRRA